MKAHVKLHILHIMRNNAFSGYLEEKTHADQLNYICHHEVMSHRCLCSWREANSKNSNYHLIVYFLEMIIFRAFTKFKCKLHNI